MSVRSSLAAIGLLAGLLASPATAQTPSQVGLTISSFGAVIGNICSPFQCTFVRGTVSTNARLTLTAYGPPSTPYAVGVALPANSCIRVAGIGNGLLLASPIITHLVGMIGGPNPALPCRQGLEATPLSIPAALSGFSFAMQSVGLDTSLLGGVSPAFSTPLLLGVR